MRKNVIFLGCFLLSLVLFSQSIEIISTTTNPLEVNPLLGGNLAVNYKYTSEVGSAGNHIYIGLELLDGSNSYISTIAETTLHNQTPGTNLTGSVNFFISSNNTLSTNLTSGYYYQIKTILYGSGGWIENAWSGNWNTPRTTLQDTSGIVPRTNTIAKGVDISWMTEMQAAGYVWKDNAGNTKNLMPLLKEYQINAIRLRVWVDPSVSGANGWCDIPDMVNKAKLAIAQGMDIMICIHYSDYWADPGKQNKPAAWTSMTVPQLETAISNHTTNILTALATEGITPKWVQIGNETNNGMLWDTGKASVNGFINYSKFVNAGNNAVKSFSNNIKTIVHLSNGFDNNLYQWNIGGLVSNGAQFDIIGMSLYPEAGNWINLVNQTYTNMLDMKSRYGKDVMITEVGFSSSTPNISYQFLVYIFEKTREASGLGVFYWEPITHNGWKSYSKGAWDNDGSPSLAMNAFINSTTLSLRESGKKTGNLNGLKLYPNPVLEKLTINLIDNNINSVNVYDLAGRKLKQFNNIKNKDVLEVTNLPNGVYVLFTNTKEQYKFVKM